MSAHKTDASGEPPVLVDVLSNGCGRLTLHRPRALNALNMEVVHIILSTLQEWLEDDRVTFVLFVSTGTRAFCAGGDIRALVTPAYEQYPADFLRDEYRMDHLISAYPKPVLSVMKGITMGGGVGISLHGTYRVLTDTTLFAMPETGIGLFPDVGGTRFLGCLGAAGTWMGLTGARLKAADAMHAGIGTHFVPLSKLDEFVRVLQTDDSLRVTGMAATKAAIGAVLARFVGDAGAPPMLQVADAIELAFGEQVQTVEEIVATLQRIQSGEADLGELAREWAGKQLKALNSKSPLSLKVTLIAQRNAAKLSVADALVYEYRIGARIIQHRWGDFHEGVRAVIIEKDKNPRWSPSSLEGVPLRRVQSMLEPFTEEELAQGLREWEPVKVKQG